MGRIRRSYGRLDILAWRKPILTHVPPRVSLFIEPLRDAVVTAVDGPISTFMPDIPRAEVQHLVVFWSQVYSVMSC